MHRPEMRLSLEQSMGVVGDGIRLGLRAKVIILFIKVVVSEREPMTRHRRGGGGGLAKVRNFFRLLYYLISDASTY